MISAQRAFIAHFDIDAFYASVAVRDDPSLRRATVTVDDAGAFADLDTPADWRVAEKRVRA